MEKTNTILPLTISRDVEYLPKLSELLYTYVECVRKEPNLSDIVAMVENSTNVIISVIELYYEGKIADAYNKIIGLDYFSTINKEQYIRIISDICNGTEHKTLYRGRCSKESLTILDLAMHPRDCEVGEYIIPQLLMQFCINSDEIDGIRYLSVNQPQKCVGHASPLYVNYAFPAPYENKEEYSKKLAEKFKITSAVCLQGYGQLSAANIHTVTHWGE